ncbi:MAG: hypothetical protein Tsb0014_35690 [Pleurocapsa sp.]
MNIPIWLIGILANHRRSRILQDVLSAKTPDKDLPESGICLLFGKEFQEAETIEQNNWYEWSQQPSRMLLLLPPFKTVECSVPCQWSVYRNQNDLKQNLPLPKLLAPEVVYELQGQLQIAKQIGGQWDNLGINTAYYRQHSHSGLFAITCLPLWSIALLDRQSELNDWLAEFYSLVGQAIEPYKIEQTALELKPEHYTVLLHLLSQNFTDRAVALVALENSPIFSLELQVAQSCLIELESQGLIAGVKITPQGMNIIRQSPYSAYAEALTP